MVEQKSSLLERLKVCWNVLTKKNYVYFGIGKEPVLWDENGKYKEIDKNRYDVIRVLPMIISLILRMV